MITPRSNSSSALLNPLPHGAPFQGARRYPLYPSNDHHGSEAGADAYFAPLPWDSRADEESAPQPKAPLLH